MINLLELSENEDLPLYERKVVEGLSNVVEFLPGKKIDELTLGESELWSTHFNPLLTTLSSSSEDKVGKQSHRILYKRQVRCSDLQSDS
jgi:hypothetical protein